MATTYDKHDAIKEMVAHRLDPEQAEGIARAMAGLAGAHVAHADLVTKDDLKTELASFATKADLRAEMAALEARILRWFVGLIPVQIAGVMAILIRLGM